MAHSNENFGSHLGEVVSFDPYRGRGDANPSTNTQTRRAINRRKLVYSYLVKNYSSHSEKFNSSKVGRDQNDTAFYYQHDDLLSLLEKSSTPLRRRGINRLELLTDNKGFVNQELFIDTVERYGNVNFLIGYCKKNDSTSK